MSLAESITGIAGTVLDKFVEDKDLKAKLQHEMNMQLHMPTWPRLNSTKMMRKETGFSHLGDH